MTSTGLRGHLGCDCMSGLRNLRITHLEQPPAGAKLQISVGATSQSDHAKGVLSRYECHSPTAQSLTSNDPILA